MKDKDVKLIWEAYAEAPNAGGRKTSGIAPRDIRPEHLMYPNYMPGLYFEEDHLTEIPHFKSTYEKTRHEAIQDAVNNTEEGDVTPDEVAVFVADLKYELTDDHMEGVVVIYADGFSYGFYVNSSTHVPLDENHTHFLLDSEITWNYGTPQQPKMKTEVPRNEVDKKYEQLRQEYIDSLQEP